MTATPLPAFGLPFRVKLAMFVRMLAVQGSWNYETLLGTGIGFVMEPALKFLPGGVNGPAYRSAPSTAERRRDYLYLRNVPQY